MKRSTCFFVGVMTFITIFGGCAKPPTKVVIYPIKLYDLGSYLPNEKNRNIINYDDTTPISFSMPPWNDPLLCDSRYIYSENRNIDYANGSNMYQISCKTDIYVPKITNEKAYLEFLLYLKVGADDYKYMCKILAELPDLPSMFFQPFFICEIPVSEKYNNKLFRVKWVVKIYPSFGMPIEDEIFRESIPIELNPGIDVSPTPTSIFDKYTQQPELFSTISIPHPEIQNKSDFITESRFMELENRIRKLEIKNMELENEINRLQIDMLYKNN